MCWRCHRSGCRAKICLRYLPRRFRGLEISWILFISRKARVEAVWKLQYISVVILQRIVVALTFDGNAVLGARQFILQAQEIFVRLQLRVILHHHQQPPQRVIQLPVGSDFIGRRLRRKQSRPRLRDVSKDGHLLLRISLDRLHQIRNQIGAPLKHDVHLRPGRFNRLILCDKVIFHSNVLAEHNKYDYHNYCQHNQALAHVILLEHKILSRRSAGRKALCSTSKLVYEKESGIVSTAAVTCSTNLRYRANTSSTSAVLRSFFRSRISSNSPNTEVSILNFAPSAATASLFDPPSASPSAISAWRNRVPNDATERSKSSHFASSFPETISNC